MAIKVRVAKLCFLALKDVRDMIKVKKSRLRNDRMTPFCMHINKYIENFKSGRICPVCSDYLCIPSNFPAVK